jgi:hypothetical protein
VREKWRPVSLAVALIASCAGGCGDERQSRLGVASRGEGHPPDSPGAGTGGSAAGGGAGRSGSPGALRSPGASFAPGSVCEPTGWCWYNPLPSGASWSGIAGAGRTDLWIGGPGAYALHFDGGRWSLVSTPIIVQGIWGASENDVWFSGYRSGFDDSSAVAHWDGAALTVHSTFGFGVMDDVWGSGANDVYAVGFHTLQHWDGAAWTTVPEVAGGRSISGSGPNDVWVAGFAGLFHFDGASWTRFPEIDSPNAVTVAAAGDAWTFTFLQGIHTVYHFDGASWQQSIQITDDRTFLSDIHAASSRDVWLVGYEFTDRGAVGYLNHFDGTRWTRGPQAPTMMFRAESAPGFGTIAVGGDGGILRLTPGQAPGFVDLRSGPATRLTGTFGTAPTDMWAVGDEGTVLHYDGQTVASVPAGTTAHLTDVWGTGPSDVWAVGHGGTIVHYDGRAFAPIVSGTSTNLNAVFAVRPDDVWIGGDAGTLLHWDGTSVSAVVLPGADAESPIRDIHGLGSDDIWLSGGRISSDFTFVTAFTSHFNGTAWSSIETRTSSFGTDAVPRIWELAPNDVWAATDRTLSGGIPIYWHFDGTAWSEVVARPSAATFMLPNQDGGSFVFGANDRWIVGAMGLWQRNTN